MTQMLKWKQVPGTFDLVLENPEIVDIKVINELLERIKTTKAWGRNFNRIASSEFDKWLNDLASPLKEQSYALLSNWFLTDIKCAKESDLAKVAKELWNKLFCCVPERRLTKPDEDYKIIKEAFDLWWHNELKCQK
jgi:hypothetical protein